jgi:hypothetical protein
MLTTTGAFQNRYTFTIVNHPGGFEAQLPLIHANAVAVINYLFDFISWNGTLDFYVRFGEPFMFGHNGSGLLPAYGGVALDGNTFAASEAFTGIDANGSDGDLGAWLLPNADGTLTNYGVPLSFDPSPDPYAIYSPPEGTHDFFSIYLHEVMHGLGFWSVAQHGSQFGASTFDALIRENNGVFEFVGAEVNALLGQNLRLAASGSRDHYGGIALDLPGYPSIERGLMFEFGNYDQNRWHLGQLELAVLADLGWTVANRSELSIVELPDQSPNLFGNADANVLFGDHQNNTLHGLGGDDVLHGNRGDDILIGGPGNDLLDGGAGLDTAIIASLMFASSWRLVNGNLVINSADGSDTLVSIERIQFNDWAADASLKDSAAAVLQIWQFLSGSTPDEASFNSAFRLLAGMNGMMGTANGWNGYATSLADSNFAPEFASKYKNLDVTSFIDAVTTEVFGHAVNTQAVLNSFEIYKSYFSANFVTADPTGEIRAKGYFIGDMLHQASDINYGKYNQAAEVFLAGLANGTVQYGHDLFVA